MLRGKTRYFLFSTIILAADQLTKIWAIDSLKPVGSIEIVPGFFRLTYAVNRGVAFSLFADSAFNLRWILATISAAAALMVMSYLWGTAPNKMRANSSLALLLAGITGNLIDRVRLGEVVDLIDFHWADRFAWPTFNIADAAICIGAVLLAFEFSRVEKAASLEKTSVASK